MPIPEAPAEELLSGVTDPAIAGSAIAAPADRRAGTRTHHRLSASLITLDGRELLRGTTDDVGEGGMHVTRPDRLLAWRSGSDTKYSCAGTMMRADRTLTGEGHYATVVRTRFLVGDSGHQGPRRCGPEIRSTPGSLKHADRTTASPSRTTLSSIYANLRYAPAL